MTSDSKIVSLIVKLNKLTSTGKLKWRAIDPPSSIVRGTDDHIPLFMITDFKGQTFAMYQHRYQNYDGDRDSFYWAQRVVFAILGAGQSVLWENSQFSPALTDLFETARRKVANIDGLLDSLLSDD